MRKLVLIGTNHKVQYFDYEGTNLFERIVRGLIESSLAEIVLEEGDPEGERFSSDLRTIGWRVAEEDSLPRANIAPPAGPEFSTTHSVPIGGTDVLTYGPVQHQINRENYMLGGVEKAMRERSVGLLICGLAHLGSIAENLVAMGFQIEAYEWQEPSRG